MWSPLLLFRRLPLVARRSDLGRDPHVAELSTLCVDPESQVLQEGRCRAGKGQEVLKRLDDCIEDALVRNRLVEFDDKRRWAHNALVVPGRAAPFETGNDPHIPPNARIIAGLGRR